METTPAPILHKVFELLSGASATLAMVQGNEPNPSQITLHPFWEDGGIFLTIPITTGKLMFQFVAPQTDDSRQVFVPAQYQRDDGTCSALTASWEPFPFSRFSFCQYGLPYATVELEKKEN